MWPRDVNDIMHQKRARRIWGIWKKSQLVELDSWVRAGESSFASDEEGWLSLAHRGLAAGVARDLGQMEKSAKKDCVFSPYVEKPFNSKVIKSFVPELRSRKCFSCFRIPILFICTLWTLWTFCVPVWIFLFHIFMYSYVTTFPIEKNDIYLKS